MWAIKVKTKLCVEYLWDIVSKGCVEPTYEEDEKNNLALYLIWQGLDENILPKIEEATSAKEA